MIFVRYIILLALRHVNAQTPIPPSAPNAVPTFPPRVENAAVWHQAVTVDAEYKANNSNQDIYLQIAWCQILENSSVSYLSGNSGTPDAAPYVSQLLQAASTFPGRFDRAQASTPELTPST